MPVEMTCKKPLIMATNALLDDRLLDRIGVYTHPVQSLAHFYPSQFVGLGILTNTPFPGGL